MSQSPRNRGAHCFPREFSLKQDRQILEVFDSGAVLRGRYLTFFRRAGAERPFRVALRVAVRNGPAPRRNRIKRLIRENLRLRLEQLAQAGHLVIVARVPTDSADVAESIHEDIQKFIHSL